MLTLLKLERLAATRSYQLLPAVEQLGAFGRSAGLHRQQLLIGLLDFVAAGYLGCCS